MTTLWLTYTYQQPIKWYYDTIESDATYDISHLFLDAKNGDVVEKQLQLWCNKERGYSQDTTGGGSFYLGQTVSNVKITVDYKFTDETLDRNGKELIAEKWVELRSFGIVDFYSWGMADDLQTVFKPVGGGFVNADDYLSIGDIGPDCARIIELKLNMPATIDLSGLIFAKLIVQADN